MLKKQDTLGQFEQLILAAVSTIPEAYGITIHAAAEKLGQRALKLGAVYATLDRMEDKGFLSSWMTDPTPERGGRPKRCYKVEPYGRQALTESTQAALRIHEAIKGKPWWKPRIAKVKT